MSLPEFYPHKVLIGRIPGKSCLWFELINYKYRHLTKWQFWNIAIQNPGVDQTKNITSEGNKYKRILKEEKKMYKQKLIKEMAVLKQNNPKLYREILVI